MFNWLKKSIIKKLVRRVKIYEKEEYPSYLKLRELASVNVVTIFGHSTFVIKEDLSMVSEPKDRYRYFTVELLPVAGPHDNRDLFEDKVMLMVEVNLFEVNQNVLLSVLIDVFLDNISHREEEE